MSLWVWIIMLSGRRLVLRPLQESDAPELHRWFNDSRVLEDLGARHAFFCVSMEEERRIVRGMLEDRRRKAFVILESEAGRPVGLASYVDIDERNASVGIQVLIGEVDRWGMGYCREATRLLLEHAFRVMNMHRVHLRVAEYNTRAIRCYEGCGFRVDGRLRHDHFHGGGYRDSLIMSALSHEFQEGEDD